MLPPADSPAVAASDATSPPPSTIAPIGTAAPPPPSLAQSLPHLLGSDLHLTPLLRRLQAYLLRTQSPRSSASTARIDGCWRLVCHLVRESAHCRRCILLAHLPTSGLGGGGAGGVEEALDQVGCGGCGELLPLLIGLIEHLVGERRGGVMAEGGDSMLCCDVSRGLLEVALEALAALLWSEPTLRLPRLRAWLGGADVTAAEEEEQEVAQAGEGAAASQEGAPPPAPAVFGHLLGPAFPERTRMVTLQLLSYTLRSEAAFVDFTMPRSCAADGPAAPHPSSSQQQQQQQQQQQSSPVHLVARALSMRPLQQTASTAAVGSDRRGGGGFVGSAPWLPQRRQGGKAWGGGGGSAVRASASGMMAAGGREGEQEDEEEA